MDNSIRLDSSKIVEDKIGDLRDKNDQFKGKYEDLHTRIINICEAWTGDASKVFKERFDKEYPLFETFYDNMKAYIDALEQIRVIYEQKEQYNIELGKE